MQIANDSVRRLRRFLPDAPLDPFLAMLKIKKNLTEKKEDEEERKIQSEFLNSTRVKKGCLKMSGRREADVVGDVNGSSF